jgi:hypothetical protein
MIIDFNFADDELQYWTHQSTAVDPEIFTRLAKIAKSELAQNESIVPGTILSFWN